MKTTTQIAIEAIGFAPKKPDLDEMRKVAARNLGVGASIKTLRKLRLRNWQEIKLDGMTILEDGTILRRASA